ncbi:MAG: DinB family protein [Chloroflexota bacterium]
MSNNAISLLRAQYTQMFGWLEGTMAGVSDEVMHYVPPGDTVATIGAQAAHIVTGVDGFLLGMAAGQAPLMASSYANKTGISEPPPQGGDWGDWKHTVLINGPELHEYAKAVFAAADSYLATLSDSDLENELDMGSAGKQTLQWVLTIMILNTYSHTGEIAAIKGLQGLKGYPF